MTFRESTDRSKEEGADVLEADTRRFERLRVCVNFRSGDTLPSCAARGSVALADTLERGLAERGIDLAFERVHCLGKCHIGPTMKLLPAGPYLLGASERDVPRILDLLEAEDFETLAQEFPNPETIG